MSEHGTRRRLFLVGISKAHVQRSIARAQRLGFEVILGDSEPKLAECADLVEAADRTVVTDYTDVDALLATAGELGRPAPLNAIVTFKEEGSEQTARVAERLGLSTNSPRSVRACNDKAVARALLDRAGLPGPRWTLCQDAKELRRFIAEVAGPVVIKPRDLFASVGVARVDPDDDAEAALKSCLAAGTEPVALVEEFVVGREISIEAMLYRGTPVVFGVTEKLLYPGTFVERGHVSPDPGDELTPAGYRQLVGRITAALGLRQGPLHIEGYHTARGFVPGEIHTRYGGDDIVEVTEQASRCDMTTPVFAELCRLPYGIVFGAPPRVCGIRFLDVPPGRVRSISGVAEVSRLPGVLRVQLDCQVGDQVVCPASSFDRPGSVIAVADRRADLERTFDRVAAELCIETE
ncbi:MAG: hypothetical protein AUG49_19800 [Catenulispora sp. 13_1_20CM_3_70_7]|nr:MAG: hypothetical protein AUG49_19800 [Catenulispora sp. 13_1_20CM_3_70_7]